MIRAGICHSFLLEVLQGIHRPEDVYMMALFRGSAELSSATEGYGSDQEVSGQGYQAGGTALRGYAARLDRGVAFLDWDDPIWENATIRAAGGLIYNASRQNRAVAVVDLGDERGSVNAPFRIELPRGSAETAVVRLGL